MCMCLLCCGVMRRSEDATSFAPFDLRVRRVSRPSTLSIDQLEAGGRAFERGQVGVDALDAADAGQRVVALVDDLAGALLGEQVHHHPGSAWRRWPGPSHRRRREWRPLRRCSSWPGRRGRHLKGAEHADVEVAAAHHGEAVGVVKVGATGQQRDRLLAGVDEVVVFLPSAGAAPMPRMPFSLCSTTSRPAGRWLATTVGWPMPRLTTAPSKMSCATPRGLRRW